MMTSLFVRAATLLDAALRDRRGVTSLEYGVVAGALILAIAGAMTLLGTSLSTAFGTLGDKITNAF